MLTNIPLNNIQLTDPELLRGQNNTINYLLSLAPDRFLYGFQKVAGLPTTASKPYGGWERLRGPNFRGHFLGHYLSALAQGLDIAKDDVTRSKLLAKLELCITGLNRVQQVYTTANPQSAGYLSAFNEIALAQINGSTLPSTAKENVLVPWYILHKILAGLIDTYEHLQQYNLGLANTALHMADQFGTYIYHRVSQFDDRQKVLKTEYGGMNAALYHLFTITKDRRHLAAATYFDDMDLFNALAAGKDILTNQHANTMIPKVIGALSRYECFSDPKLTNFYLDAKARQQLPRYLKAAQHFWDMVVNHHTYVTGGNSQNEHFHSADDLYHDAVLADGATTCETCNTYNMLKLSRALFKVTGAKQYLDYYEQTYTNAILGSQNPKTGMLTYFQPMAAGYYKVFNRHYNDFWCCTGTGCESFTKLADSYYFLENNTLYVTQYFANQLILPAQNLRLNMAVDRQTGAIAVKIHQLIPNEAVKPMQLKFRIPDWCSQDTELRRNQIPQNLTETAGFITMTQVVPGDTFTLHFKMTLTLTTAPDNPHYVALKYGPYVLAGLLGDRDLTADRPCGTLVRAATRNPKASYFLTSPVTWSQWLKALPLNYQLNHKTPYLISVTLPNVNEPIEFVPYYQIFNQRYGIYFQWQQAE
ncbi:hypothetical protein FC83_GL001999 [Agrilactobacillus composti DSM 18527 = JCM 14202]|uniref:Non-reducing end beta-L-arabinofuranosidase-like GH127 catalytic domain-containing protein n=1 Tax=Agrilactobacillus composti DSM 18527 = JCM 14202 TaxID=1423734 RepID=X0PMJ4_9LACO|nr:beta-L-arabinofuranosidase domain-containing protein [Agrilactobacillus composti]KRM34861.1 hypothetical protein FC83_GL001999 [Agrilactobacillus composti DSM 18527 = JCM 14202]GAF38727.1 glycosyl hydrolase [Agrilactobacillus composti DSM 18527 = JCM 14202]